MGFGGFDVDNEDRAGWANAALNAHAAATHFDPREQTVDVEGPDDKEGREYAEEVMGDLLANLRHLADMWGLDFDSISQGAEETYLEEVAEEGAMEDEQA